MVSKCTGISGSSETIGNSPGLRAVGEIAVGKNDDRHHVFDGDAAGFHGDPEAIAGSGGREHGNGRFGVAAVESLQQVGLLGFGRQAGGRSAALDVADDEREFDGDGEAHGFGFQRHAGAGSGGDAERAGISRADRGSDGGDFVFGLKGDHAEIFVGGKLVQNVGRRRDRIGAEKKRQCPLFAKRRRSPWRARCCR